MVPNPPIACVGSSDVMVPNPPPLPVVVAVDEAPTPWWWWWLLLMALAQEAFAIVAYKILDHSPNSPASALFRAMMCCSALQAAAAALALALLLARRRRRIRRALVWFATVTAAVDHCMYAGFIGLAIATYPGKVLNSIFGIGAVFVMAAGDLLCFLSLRRRDDQEEDY